MNAVTQWFQDWSDACVYARECAPDLSFIPSAPFPALFAIAAGCFFIWWMNEREIARLHKYESRVSANVSRLRADDSKPVFGGEALGFALDRKAA